FRHAIRQLARSPMLGLLDLRALFRARMLDTREHLLDLVFRSRRAGDENQIVQTLFHDDLFPSVPGARPGKIRKSLYVSLSGSAALRRLYFVLPASSPCIRISSTASPASPSISAATSSSAFFMGRSTYSLRLLTGCSEPAPSRSLANCCVPIEPITDFAPL